MSELTEDGARSKKRKKKSRNAEKRVDTFHNESFPNANQSSTAENDKKGSKHTYKKWRKQKKKTGNGEDAVDSLPINEDFAKKYDETKRRELLRTAPAFLLEKADSRNDGNGGGNDDASSSSEEEDEHAELLTKGIDRRVRETLQAIRTKDPRIYDKNTCFFDDVDKGEEDGSDSDGDVVSDDEPVVGWNTLEKAAKDNTPKLTVKDYVRETILKHGKLSDGEDEDDEDEDDFDDDNNTSRFQNEDEDDIQPRFKLEVDGDDDDAGGGDDDSDDDFFTKREKTAEELENEKHELEKFIAKNSKKNGQNTGEDILLHSYLDKETPDDKERFLRDFVLNNGWLDGNGMEAPTAKDYEIEIDQTKVDSGDDADADGNEQPGEDGEDFEGAHNFRFQQKDSDKIMSYPRTIENSMRRPDDRRKHARQAKRERKQHEKVVKDEEVKRLKNAKKKEIETRLLAVREAAGNDVDLQGFDLDGDFDPDKFNQQMEKQFGDDYYSRNDAEMKTNDDIVGASSSGSATISDRPVILSKDVQQADDDMKKGVQNLINEYYQLNYEDMIDGQPMRFKYRQVDAESFHLSDKDLLEMDDAELNRLVSVKLLAPYRSKRDVAKQAWRVREKLKKRKNEVKAEQDAFENTPALKKSKKTEVTKEED